MKSSYLGIAHGQLEAEKVRDRRRAGTRADAQLGLSKAASIRADAQLELSRAASTRAGEQLELNKAAGTRAGEQLGLSKAANARAGAQLGMVKEANTRTAQKFAWEKSDRELTAAQREGFPRFLHGALTGVDPATNLAQFHRYGNMRIKSYAVQPDNTFVLTGEDGGTATIKADTVNAFMKKYYGVDLGPKFRPATKKVGDYTKAVMFADFKKYFDVDELNASDRKAVEEAGMRGVPYIQIGEELGLTRVGAGKIALAQERLEVVTAELAKLDMAKRDALSASGRTGFYFSGKPERLRKEKEALKKQLADADITGVSFPGATAQAPAAAAPAAPAAAPPAPEPAVSAPVAEPTPVDEIATGVSLDMKAMDTNRDGVINELDADYARAKRTVELASANPATRSKIVAKFGARKFAQMEALVKAVEKRDRTEADQRVQAVPTRTAEELKRLTHQLNSGPRGDMGGPTGVKLGI